MLDRVGILLEAGQHLSAIAARSAPTRGLRVDDHCCDPTLGQMPVICAANGYAIGGGHVIHVLCDVTVAAEHAKFWQAGPRVGSFDAGWGSANLARTAGEKRAREFWFFFQQYDAKTALEWGLVNRVVPGEKLIEEARKLAKQAVALSPTALKFLKHAFNADSAHIFGQVKMAADGLASFVNSEDAAEGRTAFLEKRTPDFSQFR